jgi:hypothetical protein
MEIRMRKAFINAEGVVTIVELTPEEIASRPTPVLEDASVVIIQEIEQIERKTLMNRAVREFMLLSAEATALTKGVTPEQLYIANSAYKKVKDVDIQIAALRSQL